MTQLDLFQATVSHKKEDGILFYADFTDDLKARVKAHYGIPEGQGLREFFGMFTPRSTGPRRIAPLPQHDYSVYYEGIAIPEGLRFSEGGVLHLPGSKYHFVRLISPLRNATSLAELEAFPWDFLDPGGHTTDHMRDEVEKAHADGLPARSWVGRFYEAAWQYRGYEEMLMDMYAEPDMADFIFGKLFEMNRFRAVAAAQAGVDYIECGDDVANQNNMMFSLDMWRYYQKSRWAKIYDEVRKIKPDIKIWYHSDGNITAILDELVEIGVNIVNPIQPECMDPYAVKKRYGDLITIDGAIGTQTVMPFGSAGDVRKAVKEAIEILGANGGYIPSPSHILEPEVPMENVEAFIQQCTMHN